MDDPLMERISPAATRACHEEVLVIDTPLIRKKAEHSRESKRNRDIHIFHTGDDDTLQRMLNAVQPGSYVAPHRHVEPVKAESFIVLQGSICFLTFNDSPPHEEDAFFIDPKKGVPGIDIRAGVWHCFFALEEDTVVFEVKPGPYDQATDKEFASFAPKEGDEEAPAFLAEMEDKVRTRWGLPSRKWKV